MEKEEEILICRCGDVSHQLVFTYWDGDEDKEVYATMYLNRLPFWKRLVEGVKYILGKQSKYGAFEEMVLDENDAEKLQKVADYLKHIKKDLDAKGMQR